ncbi:MAG: 2-C-methyl-D-erythritol 4-phosphate cytidylyltransferase [Bacteroidales bacterium]|nr:2-C-methyl-D-erythritol 4-phosphate cytidylyltransferase [Bacteroidales bacterium]
MKKFAIIVAGGIGNRCQNQIPKQFLLLQDRPILFHTLQRFIEADSNIQLIVALRESLFDLWAENVEKYGFNVPVILSKGGKERFHTVKSALEKVPADALVAIHDSVRPLVSVTTIRNAFVLAEKEGSAVPVTTPTESIRIASDNTFIPFNRDQVRQMQTPQTFWAKEIQRAYQMDFMPEFTDDASVYEKALHQKICLFEGNKENIKITYPQDLAMAAALLPFVQ